MEKLKIYQIALDLTTQVYILIRTNKDLSRDFSLNDQIKRSSVSVVANIAEGYLRSKKQFKNYLSISSGSANETIALLQIIEKVYEIDTKKLQDSYKLLARQIGAFSRSIKL